MAECFSSVCGSCCDGCAQCCTSVYKCCCCECLRKNPKERYAHIEYKHVGSEEESHSPLNFPTSQRKYSYKCSQDDTEFETHPQVVDSKNESAITSQPKKKTHQRTISAIQEEEMPGYFSQSSRDPSIYDSLDDLDADSQIGYVRPLPNPASEGDLKAVRTPIARQRNQSSPLLTQSYQEKKLYAESRSKEFNGRKHHAALKPLHGGSESRVRSATLATPEVSQSVKDALAHSRSQGELHTSVNFSLYYDERHTTLILHLYQLNRLQTKRAMEHCNPFVEVYLLPTKRVVYESHVEKHTLNPMFDQVFKFPKISPAELDSLTLILRVYNNDKNNFMGGVLYPLKEANFYGDKIEARVFQVDEEEFFQENSEGEILLSVCYGSADNILDIRVLEATNLQYKRDLLGPPNPYVKVYLQHHKSRHTKWKTSIRKKTYLPVFDEGCLFDISEMNINDVSIEIVLLDYDRFTRNNVIGLATLGSSVPSRSAQAYWEKILNAPEKECSSWLSLTAAEAPKSTTGPLQLCVGASPRKQSPNPQ